MLHPQRPHTLACAFDELSDRSDTIVRQVAMLSKYRLADIAQPYCLCCHSRLLMHSGRGMVHADLWDQELEKHESLLYRRIATRHRMEEY